VGGLQRRAYDVTIKELDVGPVQVQGPKSKDVMVDLFGDSILDIPYYYLRPTSSTE
jgi:aminomethyltransferase